MEVAVENLGKLKRKLSVEVALAEVQAVYDEVYARIKVNVKVNGFRPGKYPRRLAEKRFNALMEQEAIRDLVPKYFDEAIREHELRPATEPSFQNLHIDKQQPFRFEAEFEVFPTFNVPSASEFSLVEKPADLEPDGVDKRIEALRMERSRLEDKGEQSAAAGDVVSFDFRGTIDGEDFEGGAGTDQRIVIGEGQYLPDFAAAFEGIRAREEKTFSVTFPEDYGQQSLAGKTAEFKVTAQKVEKKVPSPLNKEFFKQFGELNSLKQFKAHIESELRAQKEREIQAEYRADLVTQLKSKFTFDVPERLVEMNLHEFEHRLSRDDPEALKDEKRLTALKDEEAKRIADNLRFSYIVEEMARAKNIVVDPDEVRQRFFLQAYLLQQNPTEFIKTPQGEHLINQIQQQAIANSTLDGLSDEILGKAAPPPTAKAAAGTTAPEEPAGEQASAHAEPDKP